MIIDYDKLKKQTKAEERWGPESIWELLKWWDEQLGISAMTHNDFTHLI